MEKTIANKTIEVSDEGYLLNFSDWNKELGEGIAQEEGITMTDDHWKVIDYIQHQYKNDVPLTIRKIGKSGVVDIKGF